MQRNFSNMRLNKLSTGYLSKYNVAKRQRQIPFSRIGNACYFVSPTEISRDILPRVYLLHINVYISILSQRKSVKSETQSFDEIVCGLAEGGALTFAHMNKLPRAHIKRFAPLRDGLGVSDENDSNDFNKIAGFK